MASFASRITTMRAQPCSNSLRSRKMLNLSQLYSWPALANLQPSVMLTMLSFLILSPTLICICTWHPTWRESSAPTSWRLRLRDSNERWPVTTCTSKDFLWTRVLTSWRNNSLSTFHSLERWTTCTWCSARWILTLASKTCLASDLCPSRHWKVHRLRSTKLRTFLSSVTNSTSISSRLRIKG